MSIIRYLFLVVIVSFFFVQMSEADILYLKNDNTMEGEIKEENDLEYLVDVGFGTISLKKEDVIKIEESEYNYAPSVSATKKKSPSDAKKRQGGSRSPINDEEWELYDIVKKVERTRGSSVRYARKIDLAEQSINDSRKKIEKLEKKRIKIQSDYTKKSVRRDYTKYRSAIEKDNELLAIQNKLTLKIKDQQKNIEKYQAKINIYQDNLALAMEQFETIKSQSGKERQPFFDDIEARLEPSKKKLIKKDIKTVNENYHNGVVVEALINGRVKANLVVDTGATGIYLEKRIATELGIGTENIIHEGEVKVADGRKVPVKYFLLQSMSVDDMEVKNIMGHYSDESEPSLSIDGLLGMEYLKHFNFRVDVPNKKLTLQKLKTR